MSEEEDEEDNSLHLNSFSESVKIRGKMERESEEGGGDVDKKLRRSFLVGSYSKRAGPSTPPPTWRLGASSGKEFLVDSEVSVRKLCAELWETEHFRPPVGLPRCRRRRDSDVESPSDHQVNSFS